MILPASTDDELQEMLDEADRDNDGKVSASEFLRVMKQPSPNPLDDWDSGQCLWGSICLVGWLVGYLPFSVWSSLANWRMAER